MHRMYIGMYRNVLAYRGNYWNALEGIRIYRNIQECIRFWSSGIPIGSTGFINYLKELEMK